MTAPEGKKLVLIGYMRVSKTDGSQVVDLQSDALVAAGGAGDQLYTDRASGKRDDRPGLEACLRALRDGDTLMVWKLDRLGRNLKHLVDVVQALNGRGVGLKVLTGQGAAIDTTTANGRLMFNFFAALAERLPAVAMLAVGLGCCIAWDSRVLRWPTMPRTTRGTPTDSPATEGRMKPFQQMTRAALLSGAIAGAALFLLVFRELGHCAPSRAFHNQG